ncbi:MULTISPECIES: hypothetical protein [Alteromonadales]
MVFLGLLAAVAVPLLLDVIEEAKDATVEGVARRFACLRFRRWFAACDQIDVALASDFSPIRLRQQAGSPSAYFVAMTEQFIGVNEFNNGESN